MTTARKLPSLMPSSQDQQVQELAGQLFLARHAMLQMVSEDAQAILRSYLGCVRLEDTHHWIHQISEDLIHLAEPLPSLSQLQPEDRAICPLCGEKAKTADARGFALPDGLRRHFEGTHDVRRCSVIEAAIGIAEFHWDKTFAPRGSEAREARHNKLEARRKTEIQFKVHPHAPARLLDEGLWKWQVRTPQSLAWAEQRLRSLGFESPSGALRTFTIETEKAVVYADPRRVQTISFAVFRKPFECPPAGSEFRRVPSRAFYLPDTFKVDLRLNVERGIAAAARELARHLRLVK